MHLDKMYGELSVRQMLLELADFLDTKPKFDMAWYTLDADGDPCELHDGDTHCAAGWLFIKHPVLVENGYHFVLTDDLGLPLRELVWCFAKVWQNFDNSATGAAHRIRLAVEGKIPDTFVVKKEYDSIRANFDQFREGWYLE